MQKAIWLSVFLSLIPWAPAAAQTLTIEPASSEVAFSVSNFGVHSVEGRFDHYTGKIEFNPQAPEQSLTQVTIAVDSINTQNKSRDKHLRTVDFFDAAKYPELTFYSQSIERTGNGYLMNGMLTIKGHSQPVQIPFTFSTATANGKTVLHAHGKAQINRHDFGIDYGNNFSVGKTIAIDLSVSARNKGMSFFFSERALLPERMDIEPLDEATTRRILVALENVNAWLGGVHATLSVLKRFARRWQPRQKVRFIDWGTGSADIPRAIVRWCRQKGYQAEVVGIDMNRPIIDYAREACRTYPEISLLCVNAKEMPDPAEPFDYALSSLCLHHLSNEEVADLLKRSDRITRRGILMNDLKRSVRAWAWIWGLTRIMGAHSIVKNDAPLSVRNAFTKNELEYLASQAGLSYLKVQTHFGYRFTLAGEKI